MRTTFNIAAISVIAIGCCSCTSGGDKKPRPPLGEEVTSAAAFAYVRGALQMVQRGDTAGAIEAVERARRESPRSFDVQLARGQVLMRAGELSRADSALEIASMLRPGDSRTWEMRGHLAYQMRRFREALAFYARATDQSPSPFVWQGIGSAYRELYRPDSARMAYEHTVLLDSTFAPAWSALAEIAEDEGAFESALSYAEHASRISPRLVAYQSQRARLLFRLGRQADAIPIMEEIINRDSSDYAVLYSLGLAYREVGRESLATATLEQAARLRRAQRQRRTL